jgi:hypothetical protein
MAVTQSKNVPLFTYINAGEDTWIKLGNFTAYLFGGGFFKKNTEDNIFSYDNMFTIRHNFPWQGTSSFNRTCTSSLNSWT